MYILISLSIVLDIVHRLGVSFNATTFVKLGLFSFQVEKKGMGKDPILIELFERTGVCQWKRIFPHEDDRKPSFRSAVALREY